MPAVRKMQSAADRARLGEDNLLLAFALPSTNADTSAIRRTWALWRPNAACAAAFATIEAAATQARSWTQNEKNPPPSQPTANPAPDADALAATSNKLSNSLATLRQNTLLASPPQICPRFVSRAASAKVQPAWCATPLKLSFPLSLLTCANSL